MKPSAALWAAGRRLRLTTKNGPHNYYKGNRTGAMGRHTKWGGYIVDFRRVRSYVCPDLTGFQLTPFVTKKISPRYRDSFRHTETSSPLDAKEYLKRWKEGGEDRGGVGALAASMPETRKSGTATETQAKSAS